MANGAKGSAQILAELKELTVGYAKQETVDPMKSLGRYLAFGIAGTTMLGISGVLLILALLRALQTQTNTKFTGNWSWAPYLLTSLLLICVIGGLVSAITKVKTENMGKANVAKGSRKS